MTTQLIQDLERARDLLAATPWYSPHLPYRNDSLCAVQVLLRATDFNMPERLNPAIQAVQHHLDTHSLAAWNDAPGRTKDEVLAALQATIDREQAHG